MGTTPKHCSPCFLVAKPGSTAERLVVDYGELNKKTLNHSESIPNMQSTLEKAASCRYKTKMDKRSGFWQVDLTPNAQELLAFITPQGRVFKWKVMPFSVANAPALFQELMDKILSVLRRRPVVQEVISRGAQMEAHIDDICLGTNTQEDHRRTTAEAQHKSNVCGLCRANAAEEKKTKRTTHHQKNQSAKSIFPTSETPKKMYAAVWRGRKS